MKESEYARTATHSSAHGRGSPPDVFRLFHREREICGPSRRTGPRLNAERRMHLKSQQHSRRTVNSGSVQSTHERTLADTLKVTK